MFSKRPFSRSPISRVRQRGFLMLEVSLALLLALIAGAAAIKTSQRATDATNAMTQADTLEFYRDAAETLVQENYTQFQAGQPISRNGVTLVFGTNPGEALQPTTANLKAMALGVDNAAEQGFFKSLANANYQINIQRSPAGCASAPNPLNGTLCNIKGTVCFTRPVQEYGALPGETDGFAVGKMLGRIGGNGGTSIEGVQTVITGNGGGWSEPNPIAGTPAGIVCDRFGFGSSGLASFLRLNDNRDPNFQGGMSLSGINSTGSTLSVTGTATISGGLNIGGATTLNGSTTIGGDLVIKDALGNACVRILTGGQVDVNCNGILNSKTGTFTSANGTVYIGDGNPAGLYTLRTDGAAYIAKGLTSLLGGIFNTANPNGVNYTGGKFTATNGTGATTLAVNDAGVLGSSGAVSSKYLGLNQTVAAGSVCGSPAVVVPGTDAGAAASTTLASLTGGGLASCINGKWTAIAAAAVPGAACAPDGVQAVSSTDGRSLVCKNGVFMQVNDLLSSFVLMNTYRVTDGSIAPKPVCGQLGASTGQPVSVLTPQVESSSTASFNRRTEDASATAWRVVLQEASGASLSGTPNAEALLFAYCYY